MPIHKIVNRSNVVAEEDIKLLVDTVSDAEKAWGTDFDDHNTLNDWATYVGIYVARATSIENKNNQALQYDALIKAAGLALTAAARVRQGAVDPRHYDDWPPENVG